MHCKTYGGQLRCFDATTKHTHLFNDVGTELLNGENANIAYELTDDSLAKPVVVEVKDVFWCDVLLSAMIGMSASRPSTHGQRSFRTDLGQG